MSASDLQQFLSLPSELLSALGKTQEAARAIAAELRSAQREMRAIDSAGGTTTDAQRRRVIDLQAQQAALKAQLAADKRSAAERATLNGLIGRGRRLSELPMRLAAVRGGISVENVADVGAAMRGLGARLMAVDSTSAQRVGALLSRGGGAIATGAAGVTAVGAIAAMATQATVRFLEQEAARDQQAAVARGQVADMVRGGDYSPEEAMQIMAASESAVKTAMSGNTDAIWRSAARRWAGSYGIGLRFAQSESATALGQRAAKQEAERINLGKQLGAQFLLSTKVDVAGGAVTDSARRAATRGSWLPWERGIIDSILTTIDPSLLNERILKFSLDEQERMLKTAAMQRKKRLEDVDTPEYRVAMSNRNRHADAVERDRVARLNDWNPY